MVSVLQEKGKMEEGQVGLKEEKSVSNVPDISCSIYRLQRIRTGSKEAALGSQKSSVGLHGANAECNRHCELQEAKDCTGLQKNF